MEDDAGENLSEGEAVGEVLWVGEGGEGVVGGFGVGLRGLESRGGPCVDWYESEKAECSACF